VTHADRELRSTHEIPSDIAGILGRVLSSADPESTVRRSTVVHDAVLGLNTLSIDEALREEPSALNTTDGSGFSPLHWATYRGDIAAAKALLEWGPDLAVRTNDKFGYTALHIAANNRFPGSQEIGILLIEAGANPSERSFPDGNTALHMAWAGRGPKSLEFYAAVLKAGADPNSPMPPNCALGETPIKNLLSNLLFGHADGVIDKLETLLRWGADPNFSGHSGVTPIQTLIQYCAWNDKSVDISARALGILLDAGGRLDAVHPEGCNIFQVIICSSSKSRLQLISVIRHWDLTGINPDSTDNWGNTTLKILWDSMTFTEDPPTPFWIRRPTQSEAEAILDLIQETRERNWAAGLFLRSKKEFYRDGRHTDLDEMREEVEEVLGQGSEETFLLTTNAEPLAAIGDDSGDEDGDEEFFDAPEA